MPAWREPAARSIHRAHGSVRRRQGNPIPCPGSSLRPGATRAGLANDSCNDSLDLLAQQNMPLRRWRLGKPLNKAGAAGCVPRGPNGFAQFEDFDLPGLIARQHRDKPDAGWNGKRLKVLSAMSDDIAGSERALLLQSNAGDHLLPQEVARHSHDCAFLDFGQLSDDVGNRLGIDVMAALNDQIVGPSDDEQLAIRIETGQIAGAMPTLGSGRCRARTAPILKRGPLAQIKDQFADFSRRQVAALRIDDLGLETGEG